MPLGSLSDLKSNETNISGQVENLVMKYNKVQSQKQRDMKVRDISAAARYGNRYNPNQKREGRPKTAQGGYSNIVQKIKKPNGQKERTRLDQSQKLADMI